MAAAGRPKGSSSKVKKIAITNKLGTPTKCICCGRTFPSQKTYFSPSHSPIFASNNGFLPVCRDCIDALLKKYIDELDDDEEAFKRICLHFDLYYSPEIYTSAKNGKGISFLIGSYFSRSNMTQFLRPPDKKIYKTYDDTVMEEIAKAEKATQEAKELGNQDPDAITSVADLDEAKESGDIKIPTKSVKLWGFGFSPEDYEFLESSFLDWKSKVVVDGKSREMLVRELCIIKLQQNKSLQDKSIDLYEKLSRLYQKTLENANLKPIQEDNEGQSGEKTWGTILEMVEKTEPIPDPDPEWEDVDGIVKFITIYFVGHLCKMLKLKNKYSDMYEEEMARYRVEVPDLEEAEDDDIFDYIVNGGVSDDSSEQET